MKVALFDFCDTIANFQTADAYVYYVLQHRNNSKVAKRGIVFKLFNKLRIISILGILFPHASINKRMVLSLLKGIRKEQLDRLAEAYYNDIIRTNLITEVIEEIKVKQKQAYRIVIVSGGYDIYLKYFAKEFGINDVISTRIKFVNDRCSGTFEGADCLWDNKVKLLEIYFKNEQIEKSISFAYSDSKNDMPLLRWVSNGIVVRRIDRQKWTNELNEIVWGK